MAFQLPVFNAPVSVWRHGNATTNPPDVTGFGNLSPGELAGVWVPVRPLAVSDIPAMFLRLPKCFDIRDSKAPAGEDNCEVPSGSGRFYHVRFVDDMGLGFPNEHRLAMIQGFAPWPVPFPCGIPPAVVISPYSVYGSAAPGFGPFNSFVIPSLVVGPISVVVHVAWVMSVGAGPPTVNGLPMVAGTMQAFSVGPDNGFHALWLLTFPPGPTLITVAFPVLQLGFAGADAGWTSSALALNTAPAFNSGLLGNMLAVPSGPSPVPSALNIGYFVFQQGFAWLGSVLPYQDFPGGFGLIHTATQTLGVQQDFFITLAAGIYNAQVNFVPPGNKWFGGVTSFY